MLKIGLALGLLFANGISPETVAMSGKVEVPAYAKWSRLAIKQTMRKYPDADIMDYLHIATQAGDNSGTEKFQLWLKQDDREFAVSVTVTYSIETGKVIRIDFLELPVQ